MWVYWLKMCVHGCVLLKPAVFAGGTLHIMCSVQFILNGSFHFLNHSRIFTQFAVGSCRWKTVSAKCHTSSTLKLQWVCQLHTAPTAHLLLLNCIVSHQKYQSGRVRWRKILPHFRVCWLAATSNCKLRNKFNSVYLFRWKIFLMQIIWPQGLSCHCYPSKRFSMKCTLALIIACICSWLLIALCKMENLVWRQQRPACQLGDLHFTCS